MLSYKKVEKQKKLILEFDLIISLKKITGLAVAHHGGPLMTNKVAALAKFLENVTNCHTLEDIVIKKTKKEKGFCLSLP